MICQCVLHLFKIYTQTYSTWKSIYIWIQTSVLPLYIHRISKAVDADLYSNDRSTAVLVAIVVNLIVEGPMKRRGVSQKLAIGFHAKISSDMTVINESKMAAMCTFCIIWLRVHISVMWGYMQTSNASVCTRISKSMFNRVKKIEN